MEENNNNIVIYQTDDGTTKIDVKLEDELDINSTVKEFLTVQKEGNRMVNREIPYYNLDMIISLRYRINFTMLPMDIQYLK